MRVTQPGFLALFIHHFPSKDSDAGRLARGHAMYALPSWSPLQVASYAEVIHYTGEIYVIKHRHEAREAPFLIHESRENRRDLYPWKPYTP